MGFMDKIIAKYVSATRDWLQEQINTCEGQLQHYCARPPAVSDDFIEGRREAFEEMLKKLTSLVP